MKRVFLMAVCLMACVVGVFTSCSKNDDDDVNGKTSLENCLRSRKWMLDNDEKGRMLFYKNHLVVYLKDANTMSEGYRFSNGIAFGTWRDRNGILNSTFTSESDTYKSLKTILPNNLALMRTENSTLYMEDEGYKEHTLQMMGEIEDYSDDTEHDKALHGTWKMTYTSWNINTNELVTLHPVMTINNDGTMRMVVPENNLDFKTNYTTKDGRVTFERYDVSGWEHEETFVYVHEGDKLLLFKETSNQKIFKGEMWGK